MNNYKGQKGSYNFFHQYLSATQSTIHQCNKFGKLSRCAQASVNIGKLLAERNATNVKKVAETADSSQILLLKKYIFQRDATDVNMWQSL